MVARKNLACDEWVRDKNLAKIIRQKIRKINPENNSEKIGKISENRCPKSAKNGALFRAKIEQKIERKITGEKRKTASKNRAKNPENFRKNGPVLDVRRRKNFRKIRKNNSTKIPENSENNFRKIRKIGEKFPKIGAPNRRKSAPFFDEKSSDF